MQRYRGVGEVPTPWILLLRYCKIRWGKVGKASCFIPGAGQAIGNGGRGGELLRDTEQLSEHRSRWKITGVQRSPVF